MAHSNTAPLFVRRPLTRKATPDNKVLYRTTTGTLSLDVG